jgi:hypothetical protein
MIARTGTFGAGLPMSIAASGIAPTADMNAPTARTTPFEAGLLLRPPNTNAVARLIVQQVHYASKDLIA